MSNEKVDDAFRECSDFINASTPDELAEYEKELNSSYNKVTAIEYFEKKKEILDSAGRRGGVCTGVDCVECPLYSVSRGYTSCEAHQMIEPLEAVKYVMDYEIPVDWSKVPVDTKVLVRNNKDEEWIKRYFAKYEKGRIYCWHDGKTSFTSDATIKKIGWNFAKLYEREE